MFSNEKYKDDILLQKEFKVDYLQNMIKKNEGEVFQYYVEGKHESIIELSVYDLVQTELVKRSKKSEARHDDILEDIDFCGVLVNNALTDCKIAEIVI